MRMPLPACRPFAGASRMTASPTRTVPLPLLAAGLALLVLLLFAASLVVGPSATGVGESGGRVNVYIDVVDEDGVVLNRFSAPEVRFVREIRDGPVESFGLTDKPANEFQTNFPMTGGGTLYGVSMEGASDRVLNMRLPVNHHVTYALIFRRELP